MKAVGDEEVTVENLTALTDLESLVDGRKRLKGYSQEIYYKRLKPLLVALSLSKPHRYVIY